MKAGLRVLCGPGTYVRSLVSDIGTSLGCGASVAELRRLRSGPFGIEGSIELERLFSGDVQVSDVMMTMEEATSWLPSVEVSSEGGLAVSQGKPSEREWLAGTRRKTPPERRTGYWTVLEVCWRCTGHAGAEDDKDIHGRAIRVLRPSPWVWIRMKLLKNTEDFKSLARESVVTIGCSTVSYRGHQEIVTECVREARMRKIASVALTFERNPREVVCGESPCIITAPRTNWRYWIAWGSTSPYPCDSQGSSPPSGLEFCERLLVAHLGARQVVCR